jgi:hypothetical protein
MSDKLFIDIDAITTEFNSKVDASLSKLDKFSTNTLKIGGALTAGLTVPLAALSSAMISSAAKIETLKTSLTTALGGSADAATAAFSQIEAFASSTPFAMSEVTTAFVKLKNMGLDPSMAALNSYGNTASSMGKSLNDMVEAVADAAVGEFERLKEFGIKAKSEGNNVSLTFKGVTTTIAKESGAIEGYLQRIGNVDFAGGIEAQSKTYNGVMSTMKDNMELVSASFGDIMLPAIKSFSIAIQKTLVVLRALSPEAKKMILVIGGIAAAIGPVLLGVGTFIKLLPVLKSGMLALASPTALIVAGIAGLAAAFIYVRDNAEAFKDRFLNVFNTIRNKFIDIIKGIIEPYLKMMELLGMKAPEGIRQYFDSLKGSIIENTTEFGSFGRAIKNTLKDLGLFTEAAKSGVVGGAGGGGILDAILPSSETIAGKVGEVKEEIIKRLDFGDLSAMGRSKGDTKIWDGIADIMGLDPDKAASNLQARMQGVIKAVKVVHSEGWAELTDFTMQKANLMKDIVGSGINAISDILASGLASVFNQKVKFDPKNIISQFLSAVGGMFVQMAIPMLAGLTFGNIASGGALSTQQAAGFKFLAAGVAMKAGGMALGSSGGTSASSSGGYNSAPGYAPQMQKVQVYGQFSFQDGALRAQIANDNNRY